MSGTSGHAHAPRHPRWSLHHEEMTRADTVFEYIVRQLVAAPIAQTVQGGSQNGNIAFLASAGITDFTTLVPNSFGRWDEFVGGYYPCYSENCLGLFPTNQVNPNNDGLFPPITESMAGVLVRRWGNPNDTVHSRGNLCCVEQDPCAIRVNAGLGIHTTEDVPSRTIGTGADTGNGSAPNKALSTLRGRVYDAKLHLRIRCGASTYGTLVVAKANQQLCVLSAAEARVRMIGDHHHVKRYPLKAGLNTFVLSPGLMDKTLYGRFHNGVSPQFPVVGCSEHNDGVATSGNSAQAINTRLNLALANTEKLEPFGGFLFCLQDMVIGPMDGPPLMTVCTATFVQTELSLDSNHLATVEKRVKPDDVKKKKDGTNEQITKGDPNKTPQDEVLAKHGGLRGSGGG
jgi:hypothetical protein